MTLTTRGHGSILYLNMFKSTTAAKIVIPGGTGQLGTILSEHFHPNNEVVVISRHQPVRELPWRWAPWDALAKEIDGADAVINLAGRSVDCRYDEPHKREIMESRVDSTRAVGDAIARAANPPH